MFEFRFSTFLKFLLLLAAVLGGCEYLSRTDKLNAQLDDARSLAASTKETVETRRQEWTQLKSARDKLDAALKREKETLQQRDELDQRQRKLEGEIKYLAGSMSEFVAQVRAADIGSEIKELKLPEGGRLQNAKILKIDNGSISLLHENGVASLRVSADELPADLVKKFDLGTNSIAERLQQLNNQL
ncbi:MAG TPA: hypothetical protein PLB55_12560 [Prosthecobacter sp.]|nr:hypothetical protein [Prosthecobacter sp.]